VSLAFLGTSPFAEVVLRRLADSPHRPGLVITRPDRPRGRGRRLASPAVADAARELGLALEQPEDVAALDLPAHEHVVVCAFGALLREPLLSHPGLRNVHPSLLPRWRGAAPIERAIMAGDAETGVTIMGMVAELDAGPIYLQERLAIDSQEDCGALAERLAALAARLVLRALEEDPRPSPQGEQGMTYAAKIGPEDRRLDPGRPPAENARVVRALAPHIGAKAGALGVWRARAADGEAVAPGAIAVRDGRVLWGCAGGALALEEVQPPGGRRMAAADYARGRHG
jgi:methionyl-tRNA formyltransferase